MINSSLKEKYWDSATDKQMVISVVGTNQKIDNSMLEIGTFALEESLCSESELKFGACEANCVKFTARNTAGSIIGKTISIEETIDGDRENPMPYGVFKVASDVPTADRTKRQITAYDAMYDIINTDVKSWYAGLSFPMTLRQFRNSFFAHLGIAQVETNLVNDSMTVNKTLVATQTDDSSAVTEEPAISGKTVVTAICEINGCFGNINRNGKFEYVILKNIVSALYPAEDLFPADNLFPSDANTESMTGHYITFDYEDFQSKAITQLEIKTSEDNAGAIVGTAGNNYSITGNFLVSDKTGAELEQIANNLLPIMKQAEYTPIKSCTCVGNPCLTLGEPIRFNTTREIVETYLLQRTLTGVQSKRDSISAQGTQTHSAKVNSIRDTIESVQKRTSKLERNADHLQSTYENLEDQTNSKFEQTANSISAEVNRAQKAEGQLDASLQLKLGRDENDQVVSMINASADEINLKGNRLTVDATNFSLTKDGTATMIDAVVVSTLRYAESEYGSDFVIIETDGKGLLRMDIPKIYNSTDNNHVHFEGTPIVDNPGDGIQTYLARETWCNSKFATPSDISTYVSSALNGYAKSGNANTWFGVQAFNTDIKAPCIRDRSSTAAANVRCQDSTYYLATSATSSRRYKHDIADISKEELNPERLYNLPVRQFIYNLDYIEPDDQRYGETVCGFIAEEVEKIYPVACEYNANSTPENWDIRYIIPPMLALIQNQHKEIEQLKQDNISLKGEVDILKQRLEKMEEMLDVINSKIN